MGDEQKPYRVYRGGREQGGVPAVAPPAQERPRRAAAAPPGGPGAPARRPRTKRRRLRPLRIVTLVLALLVVLLVVWGVAGYFTLRSGVQKANGRVPDTVRAALQSTGNADRTILLLGTDHSSAAARAGEDHSDSVTLLYVKGRRIAYLTIPRDLWVPIPGHGYGKLSAAAQLGGPALVVRTVTALTNIPVEHVALVDFGSFRKLIDEVGGVTIDVPKPIRSKFECPYDQQRCQTWQGWYFPAGKQHLDGRRALVYSRVRKNLLDPADTDISRGERQQQVLAAVESALASPVTFLRLPLIGSDLLAPLTTDMSVDDILSLGWTAYRTSGARTLHCRLGGDPGYQDGQAVLKGNPDNTAVVLMVTGQSAPQPPRPGFPYAAGCVVGKTVRPGA